MSKATVQWLGHSCYRIECGGASLVLDPYDHVQGYPELHTEANYVYCSHNHGDHGYVQAVEIRPMTGEDPFEVRTVSTFHDDAQGAKRGPNLIHVVKVGGFTIAHFGDLGHLLSEEQVKELGHVDLALMPVGGHYTVDAPTAKQVLDAVGPRWIVPMHYRRGSLGFDVIAEPEAFTSLYPAEQVHECDDDTLTLSNELPAGVYVLSFKG